MGIVLTGGGAMLDGFTRLHLKALDDSWIEKALKNSFEIRGRYTISTLLHQLGYLDKWSDELLAELKQRL